MSSVEIRNVLKKEDFKSFKKAYITAKENGDVGFIFKGIGVHTAYAKYLIEYLEEYWK